MTGAVKGQDYIPSLRSSHALLFTKGEMLFRGINVSLGHILTGVQMVAFITESLWTRHLSFPSLKYLL